MVTADGERLRAARVAQGWSQLDLADKAGVRQGTISNVENGKGCRPSTLRHISLALSIPLSEVMVIEPWTPLS